MASDLIDLFGDVSPAPASPQESILLELAETAATTASSQIDALTTRLAQSLERRAARCSDPAEVRRMRDAAELLKKNRYPFYYLAVERLRIVLRDEIVPATDDDGALMDSSLPPLPPDLEIDRKLCLQKVSQAVEIEHATRLDQLGRRLASLLDRDEVPVAGNPFRPYLFLNAIHEAWREFQPDPESHALVYRLLQPDLCLDMAPILHALNTLLTRRGIPPRNPPGSEQECAPVEAPPVAGGFPVLQENTVEPEPAASGQITDAERQQQAHAAACHEVSLRIGKGEVIAFVETFLQDKWVPVLTLAYVEQEVKPQGVQDAVQTMDDLIWSVKPKITPEQRKDLLEKLPFLLGRLNGWLDRIRWHDAERDRFFAELAASHASIMRAPLAISPARRVELAIEVATEAAEQRQEQQPEAAHEATPDESAEQVNRLERGARIELVRDDGTRSRFRLAWVSPMRTRYVFSTRDKPEALSLSAETLVQALREGRVRILKAADLAGTSEAGSANGSSAGDRPAA